MCPETLPSRHRTWCLDIGFRHMFSAPDIVSLLDEEYNVWPSKGKPQWYISGPFQYFICSGCIWLHLWLALIMFYITILSSQLDKEGRPNECIRFAHFWTPACSGHKCSSRGRGGPRRSSMWLSGISSWWASTWRLASSFLYVLMCACRMYSLDTFDAPFPSVLHLFDWSTNVCVNPFY